MTYEERLKRFKFIKKSKKDKTPKRNEENAEALKKGRPQPSQKPD